MKCSFCGKQESHYVPPSLGEEGFYICDPSKVIQNDDIKEGTKMRTEHKKEPEEPKVTMCVVAGLFLVGKLVGGNKLVDPRVFTLIEDGKRMQLSPLPALPPFVIIARMSLFYPIPETDNIFKLYEQVTTPPNIVIPIAPGINAKLN